MKTVDESRLESDPEYRFRYVTEFMGFCSEDASAVQSAAMFLGPMIPEIVERTYERLLAYDATARHFLPRQAGFEGPLPENLSGLNASHPQIRFRKEHLSRYLVTLLGRTCDEKLVPYLDMVGKIHTPAAGNREIDVPLVQMNALMGFLADILMGILLELPIDQVEKARMVRAYSKLLWVQNDFITRHYQRSSGA